MSDAQSESVKAADPLEQWRDLRDGYMGAWAKAMGEAVNSEAYAKSNGVMLETYLTASAPFRDAQKKAMLSALEQLHMPSQADFISLADRLSNLELLLDDMDAKLDQLVQFATVAAAKPAPETKPTPAAKESAAKEEVKPAAAAKAEAKPLFAAKAETQPLFEAKAETKPVLAAKAEVKPAPVAKAEMKPAPAAKAETRPLFELKAQTKPAPAAKADTKTAAPRKTAKAAKKGSR